MCLKSLTKYKKECKAVTGGVSKLWMISNSDLALVAGSLQSYSVDETGQVIDEIALVSGKKFVSVGLIKNSLGVTENYAKTAETNSFEITTQLDLVISNITAESRKFVSDLIEAGEISAIVQLKSGKFIAIGLDGFTEVSAVAGGSGKVGTELNGYTVTITGIENELIRLVDPLIIPTIVEA
ncbi:hypothetical protein [Sphingobacterium multivorum]|uniref:hypothetical protein n=1 Tax=Sphingobacterium multivorum TaxID=28454 RepID=UPI0028B0D813|nr:hypothetical protein [Sphingobacterium multivorum]